MLSLVLMTLRPPQYNTPRTRVKSLPISSSYPHYEFPVKAFSNT